MAIMHYQFEAIHHFQMAMAGRGEFYYYCISNSQAYDIPAIYLIISSKIKHHTTSLRNVTENDDWENYILYMLDMIEVTASEV
jgi:hypothetical protein